MPLPRSTHHAGYSAPPRRGGACPSRGLRTAPVIPQRPAGEGLAPPADSHLRPIFAPRRRGRRPRRPVCPSFLHVRGRGKPRPYGDGHGRVRAVGEGLAPPGTVKILPGSTVRRKRTITPCACRGGRDVEDAVPYGCVAVGWAHNCGRSLPLPRSTHRARYFAPSRRGGACPSRNRENSAGVKDEAKTNDHPVCVPGGGTSRTPSPAGVDQTRSRKRSSTS